MSDCIEVLFASDKTGRTQTATCFDPHIGSTLMTYKGGGGVPRKSLSLVGNDYLITANADKPMLHVWQLNHSDALSNLRMIVAGKVTALSSSPDGRYCVAGIEGKLYIWEISTGCLLNIISHHYQSIIKIVFVNDSSYFISAGEDGVVLVWRLSDVITKQTGSMYSNIGAAIEPVYNFAYHSLPVTDIYVGHGNLNSRLYTVSADQSCKIYSLIDGTFLLSIIFDYLLTSVVANELETELFVGTNCGKIRIFSLDPYPRTLEHHVTEKEKEYFIGHEKAVTCLSISVDGRTLASGSDDEKVIIWDITSRQLLRTFLMKGPVTNVSFYFSSKNIFANEFSPSLIFQNFQRVIDSEKGLNCNLITGDELRCTSYDDEFELKGGFEGEKKAQKEQVVDNEKEVMELKQQIDKLKKINKQLYEFSMHKILTRPGLFD